MSSPLPPKKDVALALLERSSLFIHLDPRGDVVKVPPWFKKQTQLVLQIGLNMAVQIPDLEVDDEGVACTLSFSRTPHFCFVPWSVVYALVGEDGRGMVWPNDVPPEVAAQSGAKPAREPKPLADAATPSREGKRGLKAIKGGSSNPPSTEQSAPAEAVGDASEERPSEQRGSKRPSWLRVVK